MAGRDSRALLGWIALAFVVLEIVSAFFVDAPAAAIVFAALFLFAWFLLPRRPVAGVMLMLVLCLIELVGITFYEREDADDWILQALAFVLGLFGVAAGVAALRDRRPATATS